MALWTNGPARVVATGWGIARCQGKRAEIFRFPRDGLRCDDDPPLMRFFAVLDADGKRAVFRREKGPLSFWSSRGAIEPCGGADIHGAVSLSDGRLVVLATDGGEREKLVLRNAHVAGRSVVLDAPIALPIAKRVEWRSGLFKKGQLFPEDREDDPALEGCAPFEPQALSVRLGPRGEFGGTVRLFESPYGIGVGSTYSGLVAVLDKETLAPRSCARVPSQVEQFAVFVLPVPSGMLVTLVANYRQTEFVLLDNKGAVVAHRNKLGKQLALGAINEGIAWSRKTAIVAEVGKKDAVYTLTLPSLAPKRLADVGGFPIDHASTPDGATHLVAYTAAGHLSPHNWRLQRTIFQGKKHLEDELPMPDFRPPPAPGPAAAGLPRATGAPLLGLAVDAVPQWTARAGEELEFGLTVMNRGGPLSGAYVEMGGAAFLPDKVVSGVSADGKPFVACGSTTRVELPDLLLAAGFVENYAMKKADRPLPPSVRIVVRVRAERVGSSLLTIRVGPLSAKDTSGSALQGRNFVTSA